MKVLVACEFSGIVRDAFSRKGHDAWSCDILPTESELTKQEGKHIQDDILNHLNEGWDIMIAHPPCTHLAVSGCRWFDKKIADGRQQKAIDFFMGMINAPIKKIAVENPICIMSTKYKKPDQIIQPYMFGDPERKSTCLWLKNLPILKPTKIVEPEFIIGKNGKKYTKIHYGNCFKGSKEEQSKMRSIFFPGIAEAMSEQWG